MSNGILLGGAAALFTVAAGANMAFQYGTVETERFTVTEALEVNLGGENNEKEKRIKVILENGCPETFKVEDSLFHWQFYSSNLHAIFSNSVTTEGRADNTFESTHYGWRSGLLSMMENVVEATPLENEGPYILRPDAQTACKL